ncbi:beta-glucosidase [Salinarchaeum sp. Harcht-Bsk1]|uniref:beta-glucosidase n=1 Tax=Salinarchaeum sp. Harcht-Bsk1 TaxID=1333523 RepID=UPI0003422D95|nr:glycoside hydrolase family 3 C-terminal domain-containing protein [Salinarchaeum sp. Harcht-Bsk1]AGN01726.1 beta-glucosidase [Salinarchaeum sp. Harcht-Bsk1]
MDHQTDRVQELVDQLTREEKLSLVHGHVDPTRSATGYLPGVERLDVPEFRLVDGPLGVRVPGESSTAFPAPLAVAATFDPDLARQKGAAIGRETRALGQDSLLAPGLNLIRMPHCGRNFEYYSEDPVVTSAFAAASVEGVQSQDVIATPKHYVANNQETDRAVVSADVSERALRELYLPGFEAAVESGAGSVMTSYNRVNGTHMSENERLVTDVLKEEFGFDGYTVSDWYGTESTVAAANAGLDLEMPGIPMEAMMGPAMEDDGADAEDEAAEGDEASPDAGDAPEEIDLGEFEDGMPDPENHGQFAEPLGEAIDAGEVPESRLDDMVARVLGQMAACGALDGEQTDGAIDTDEHRELASEIASRGQVLLENDGVLPFADDVDVALVGPNLDEPTLGGGGSSETTPIEATTTVEGVEARASEGGGDVTVARGVAPIEDLSFFDLGEDDEEAEFDGSIDDAVAAAEDADVALVVVRDQATEALDRPDLRLPGDQDDLVEAVAAANENTVVAVRSSGPVELPWREDVAAILTSWYPGQADGESLATVCWGDVDASGRLPVTFAPESEYPARAPEQYPGVDGHASYDEGVFVGYRHFDAGRGTATYPFGHGHSYAAFEYRDATAVDESTVEVTVANVAERDGREVVQAYVRPPEADVERPERELGGFTAVDVPAGEERTVTIDLDDLAFAHYDEVGGWATPAGEYAVEIGRSAQDLRLSTTVER